MKILHFILPLTILIVGGCTGGSKIKGYKMIKSESHKVIDSQVEQFVHEKSGATIVMVKNKDQARSFMAGFRTPPYDDSGLFHIFEHAVLEGSRLYPSKSNFFHLANSSVASFINAMTGAVYTLYPYVSKSQKDFDNLMSVYLDAVFFPNTLKDPRIVKREGWRYEVDPKTKKMSINGIVLSEMKGAFAAPYRSLWFQLSRALLPDTPYSYSSGGLPSKIAGLTFEQIQDAHKKYYHPQNSVIYFYGDLDYPKVLAKLDKDFLSHFSKSDDYQRPAIPTQKTFNYPTPEVQATYPGQAGPKKDFLTKGFVLGADLTPVEESVALILAKAFSEHPAAPLKLRVTKEDLAQSSFYMHVGQDNGLAFGFEGSDASKKAQLAKALDEEIAKVVKNGLDRDLLISIVNKYEFSKKETNSNGAHRGMRLGSIVLDNWLYQKEPLSEAFDFVSHFQQVRKKLEDNGYVKGFFKKHFQENTKVRWIVLTPDADFSKKFNAGLDKQIEEALKEKSIDVYAKEDEVYQKWVKEKESPEILSKTPTLELSDIKGDESPTDYKESALGKTKVLEFAQATSGISYLTLYFDLQGVEEANLKNIGLLAELLKQTDAGKLDFKTLSQEIGTNLGGFSIDSSTYQSKTKRDQFRPTMVVSLKFLKENQKRAMELVQMVLAESQFTPADHVTNLTGEYKTGMSNSIANRAPYLSSLTTTKHFFPMKGAYLVETQGGVFEKYIQSDSLEAESLVPQMKTLLGKIFTRERLYLASVTSDASNLATLKKSIEDLKKSLPQGSSENAKWTFANQPTYDGFAIPGEVQYVTEAGSFKDTGLGYSGAMEVYSRYLNNNYMTPKLREQAGAYGGRASFSESGEFYMTTYRDPNLKRTFDIFAEAISFMKNEQLSAETLKPAILGSLKPYYSDKSIYGKTAKMVGLFLRDDTWENYLQRKKEIMETTPDTIQKISGALEKAMMTSKKGVAGNSSKLKKEGAFLQNVLDLR